MRRFTALFLALSVPAAASAQTSGQTSGTLSAGAQRVENNTNSSKLSEYRDLRGDELPLGFRLNASSGSGWLLDAVGTDLTRRDRSLTFRLAQPGRWRISALWDELPHNFSNKAASPYTSTSPGRLDVGQTMVIPLKKLGTGAGDAPAVLRSDSVAAAYASAFARPIDLENLTRTGALELRYAGVEALTISAGYKRREKTGSHLSYGPIGDRPPRTLNIQLAEPLDHVTGDLTLAAEYVRPVYQVRAEYLLSRFENAIDVMEWRNTWASAPSGAAFDTWDRAVATYGRRPLAPDNTYHNAVLTGGVALPFDSRLTGTFSRGFSRQDAELVPYAYQVDMLANKSLPRATADASINTTNIAVEYFVAPVRRVNVRAFYRRFDLDNETPISQWQYVTQDAANLNGTVAYLNKRTNQPFAWDRTNVGAETTVRLGFLGSSLVLGAEREVMDRERRQAEHVTENILRASWRARPTNWLAIRTSYLRGDRDGGEYDWRSPAEGYWYTPADATGSNNDPLVSFDDHPDMRKFDMADRLRERADVTLTLTPAPNWSLSTRARFRSDDYDSGVASIQPLINTALADREASTPGDQLGLLRSESRQLSADLTYTPNDRFGVSATYGIDVGESNMRGLEFQENNKKNPSAVNAVQLGPWTRKSSQWTADFEDATRYASVGGTFEVVPGKATARFDYTLSLADLDIVYGGFGDVGFDGTAFPTNYQFSFRSPDPVTQRSHTASLSVDFPLIGNVDARVGWLFESYGIRDWQQEAETQMYESVGSELFLRDTSRSHQWGNRLLNMGSYLAPGFTGHVIHVGLDYRFGGGAPQG